MGFRFFKINGFPLESEYFNLFPFLDMGNLYLTLLEGEIVLDFIQACH
jgi:hypothetical protein